ncbi:MAG: 4Fe-4S dicluster domain-containing protein [Candidatus Binatia bacterium]
MKKWNLIIDVARCHDCNDCFLADKDEFVDNEWLPTALSQPRHGMRWMNIERKERGQYPLVQVAYLPLPCQHCQEAPCLAASPAGTLYKREDGLVIIDPVKAKGHPEIVNTCPYGAIYWNEEAGVPQKCTGCAHLLDEGWTETRCSQVCPTEAIKLLLADDAEMASKARAEGLQAYKAELGSKPRVYYKNLHLWTKAFLAASVVYKDTDECAEGVRATVTAAGKAAGEALTNNYGDFVVDKLAPGQVYTLTLEAARYKPLTRDVTLEASLNLGQLFLEKA